MSLSRNLPFSFVRSLSVGKEKSSMPHCFRGERKNRSLLERKTTRRLLKVKSGSKKDMGKRIKSFYNAADYSMDIIKGVLNRCPSPLTICLQRCSGQHSEYNDKRRCIRFINAVALIHFQINLMRGIPHWSVLSPHPKRYPQRRPVPVGC